VDDKIFDALMSLKEDVSSIKTDIANIKQQNKEISEQAKRLDELEVKSEQHDKNINEIQDSAKWWNRTAWTALILPIALFLIENLFMK
jgi:regulator of replication initiation timing